MKFSKKLIPYIIAPIAMLVISIIYFFPQFQGKSIMMGDIQQYKNGAREIIDYREKGEEVLWTNGMFGGMPSYQVSNRQNSNFARYYEKVLSLGIARPAGYFFMGMISFFIAMVLLGVNPWVSLIGSIFFAFATSNVILFEAGHTSKIRTIMFSAPIVAGVITALRGKYLLGSTVFAIFMSLVLFTNHPQMVYYLGLTMVFLLVFLLVEAIREHRLASFWMGAGFLALGLALAVGTSASKLWTTYEYGKDTMRGKPILTDDKAVNPSSSTVDGLDWEYSMNWSNNTIDLLSTWIPKAAGGATVEMMAKDSEFAKKVNGGKATQGYPYFGGLPSTAGPYYFGAVVFLLFVLGFATVKGIYKWWFLVGLLFTWLISMGKNAEGFNRIFFDYVPMFNKFRTPNSVLSITGIVLAVFAGLGLDALIRRRGEITMRSVLIALGSALGLTVLAALMVPMMTDFSSPVDARLMSSPGAKQIVDLLKTDRQSIFYSSVFRSFMFMAVAAGVIYFYMKEKLSTTVLLIIIGLLGVVDLIQVNTQYLSASDFVSNRKIAQDNPKRAVDTQILQDTDIHYRVQDLTSDPFNSAAASKYHKTIGGYSAVKLQRIQDLMDHHLYKGNQTVYNMLNTKYFIVDNGGKPAVQRNTAALGNAWFVEDITEVATPNEEINSLSAIDPAQTAVIQKEFHENVANFNPSKNGNIALTSYHPDRMEYQYETNSEQLAVFSEMWYGPDKGWKAYIDGNEVPILRADYALRALKVPAGRHQIKMEFHPKSYYSGETISLLSSIALLVMALGAAFMAYRQQTNQIENTKS